MYVNALSPYLCKSSPKVMLILQTWPTTTRKPKLWFIMVTISSPKTMTKRNICNILNPLVACYSVTHTYLDHDVVFFSENDFMKNCLNFESHKIGKLWWIFSNMVTLILCQNNLFGFLLPQKVGWLPNIIHFLTCRIPCHFLIHFYTCSSMVTSSLRVKQSGTPLISQPMRDFEKRWSWSLIIGMIGPNLA
jgi:hypothetical protein